MLEAVLLSAYSIFTARYFNKALIEFINKSLCVFFDALLPSSSVSPALPSFYHPANYKKASRYNYVPTD